MSSKRSPVVSVVVPAHNAEATIAATLASALAQTLRDIEIIVVDDGSTDATAQRVADAACGDPRLRLIRQDNGGVAVARNAAITASRGRYVAPLDADDLWHPEKLARQVEVMERMADGPGFVYTGFRRIDLDDRTVDYGQPWSIEGPAFLRLLLVNFVGNGSGALYDREALCAIGCFEPALREAGLQGTEDYLAQILVARTRPVGVVPAYLTGYRLVPGAMSDDRVRMWGSRLKLLEIVRERCPEAPADVLALAEASVRAAVAVHLLGSQRAPAAALAELVRALALAPRPSLEVARHHAVRRLRSTLRRRLGIVRARGAIEPVPFLAADPAYGTDRSGPLPLARWIEALAGREAQCLPARPLDQPVDLRTDDPPGLDPAPFGCPAIWDNATPLEQGVAA